jgi:hypothetical protein
VITDSFQPISQGNQVRVRTEEPGYNDDPSSIPMRNAESVISR